MAERKPQVGEVWRLPDATVQRIDREYVAITFGFGSYILGRDWFTAHATLIKPAPPPPLKVGDMVRLPWWTDDAAPRPIAFIGGSMNEAVIDLGDLGLSRAYKLSDLTRAEET